tara:strand:+ start:320 stop:1525 length:1206 start_codon:yes stop_codon:yes gene_type:complete
MDLYGQKTVELDRRRAAFTLVELLGVVAIMLIILRLTLPSLDGILGGDGDGMARTQVVGDLNRARQMALEKGVPVYMVFMPLYDDIYPNSGDPLSTPPIPPRYTVVGGTVFSDANKRAYFSQDKGVNALLGSQLTSYAIYSEYLITDQPGNPSTRWWTDWKTLPAGYHFNRSELNGLARVPVEYLKGSRPPFADRVGLELPCIKFNKRGELESNLGGRVLEGVFLSVGKGGVLPPGKNQFDAYIPGKGDPPEAVASNDRKWFHINGVTGRTEIKELSEEEAAAGLDLQKSQYQLFIHSSPIYPPHFENAITSHPPIVNLVNELGAVYDSNWKGPGTDWSVAADKSFPSTTWFLDNTYKLKPAYKKIPDRQSALRLKARIERLAGQAPALQGKPLKVYIRSK